MGAPNPHPLVIALCGKGGVGKTSLAALLVRALGEQAPGARILAIDADPAVGLATALGVQPQKTLDDIRMEFVSRVRRGETGAALDWLGEADFEVTGALAEGEGFALLAIGRPEGEGCYCKVNGYLKQVISTLANRFDVVVIDCEAGLEQMSRRVLDRVTHLLLVSDTSAKGLAVLRQIKQTADEMLHPKQVYALINRMWEGCEKEALDTGGVEVAATIEEDPQLRRFDTQGRSLLEMQRDTPAARAAEILGALLMKKQHREERF